MLKQSIHIKLNGLCDGVGNTITVACTVHACAKVPCMYTIMVEQVVLSQSCIYVLRKFTNVAMTYILLHTCINAACSI